MPRLNVHNVDLSKANFITPLDRLVQKILVARGIFSDQDLDHRLANMPSPAEMLGMQEATNILVEAIQNNKKILIIGDYDADGATATALAMRLLKALGVSSPSYLVPNRFEYGYGLSKEIAEVALEFAPDLVITVDNGISSVEGVSLLRGKDIQVIVTDHHLPGAELPAANAILNPNQPGCAFPSKSLAGVGVLFYLMVSVRTKLRSLNWFNEKSITEPRLEGYLDLVALGTVADLVPLDHLNRIFVSQGLKLVRSGAGNPGIRAIFEVAGRESGSATSADFGFAVGPRVNAAGRLDDISEGIRCLLEDDYAQARMLALDLHHTNLERRQIQEQMVEEAESIYQQVLSEQDGVAPYGICCYQPDWHQGVVGLVASKLKESAHRPAIAFAKANPDDLNSAELKGSARSIEGLHIRDLLDRIATKYPGLIEKFGGHAMAVGLSISESRYEEFSSRFDLEVRAELGGGDLRKTITSDGELDEQYFNIDFARQLAAILPWGQRVPEPLFHGCFKVNSLRWLKDKHLKMELEPDNQSSVVEGIWFNANPESEVDAGTRLTLAYRLAINEFRGRASLQLVIVSEVS